MVAIVALTLALLVGALVFRERPPYEFLHGAGRVRTTVGSNSPSYPLYATTTYVSDLSPREISERARTELAPLGWWCSDRVFAAQGGTYEEIWMGEFGPVNGSFSWDERLRGKTYISTSRPATGMDRFNAWLDRQLKR